MRAHASHPRASFFVSVASAWEAAIKIALGKLRLPESFEAGVTAAGSITC
jgi:PIN domain nuclease of toxin-antitoxin system